jgi:hypothetical protein
MRACPKSGKKSFPSKKRALKLMRVTNERIQKAVNYVSDKPVLKNVYQCPFCLNWHHTSK